MSNNSLKKRYGISVAWMKSDKRPCRRNTQWRCEKNVRIMELIENVDFIKCFLHYFAKSYHVASEVFRESFLCDCNGNQSDIIVELIAKYDNPKSEENWILIEVSELSAMTECVCKD